MTFTPTAATNQQAMTDACNQYDADQTTEQQDEAQLKKDLDMSVSSDDVSYILTILCDCLAVYGDKAAMDTDSQNVAAAGLSFESSISQEIAAGGAGGDAETQDLVNNLDYFYDDLTGYDSSGQKMNIDTSMIDAADKASLESNLENISTQIFVQINIDKSLPPPSGNTNPDALVRSANTADITNALKAFVTPSTTGGTINPQFNSIQDSTQAMESTLGTMNQVATTDYQANVSMCNEIESVAGDFISNNKTEMQYFASKQVTN